MTFYITLSACKAELAELPAQGARLNAGNSYELLVVIYWQWQGEDRGHGRFSQHELEFSAEMRVLCAD